MGRGGTRVRASALLIRPFLLKAIIVLATSVVAVGALAAAGISAVIGRTVVADGENIHYQIVRTVADGFDSGWHIHPGLAIVQVQEGSLQITQGGCTPKTVGPGRRSSRFRTCPSVVWRREGLPGR
jgi:hypothetical protein